MDALTVFTFLWSNICVLQCVKQYHSVKLIIQSSLLTFDLLIFIALIAAVVYASLQPTQSSALFFLCFVHIIALVYQGSQSNHVIMATFIASAVLIDYSKDRDVWGKRLSGTLLLILIILYFISWIHKMNEDWFNPTYSCASLFASGFLSMWISTPSMDIYQEGSVDIFTFLSHLFARGIITTAPYQAAAIEFVLPSLLIYWKFGSSNSSKISVIIFRSLMVLAAAFHLIICFPLPPLSVYPFSMVMVPMYVLMLPSESVQVIKKLTSNIWMIGGNHNCNSYYNCFPL
jgi:hypothetical protein